MKWLSHKTMMFSVRLGTVQSSTEVTIDNRYRVYNFFPHSVMYDGQCRDLYEDGICALGERLFLIEGNPQCECDGDEVNKYQIISAFTISFFSQGWLRHEGRCYQEFTPAFCGENEILNLGTRKKLKKGQTYSCVRNPCGANKLGHR